MPRGTLPIASVVFIAAATAIFACWMLGAGRQIEPVCIAAGITLLAGELALTPRLLWRENRHTEILQSALAGTSLHLLLSIALGAGVAVLKVAPASALLLWLAGFYWITLMTLAIVYVRAMQSADAAAAGGNRAA